MKLENIEKEGDDANGEIQEQTFEMIIRNIKWKEIYHEKYFGFCEKPLVSVRNVEDGFEMQGIGLKEVGRKCLTLSERWML